MIYTYAYNHLLIELRPQSRWRYYMANIWYVCVFRPTSLKKLASSKPWVAPFTLGNRQSGYTMLYSPLFLWDVSKIHFFLVTHILFFHFSFRFRSPTSAISLGVGHAPWSCNVSMIGKAWLLLVAHPARHHWCPALKNIGKPFHKWGYACYNW